MTLDRKTANDRIRAERARALANIAAETSPPDAAWWLSFADDDGFLGAVILHANDFCEAHARSHLMQLNPGGEMHGTPVPAEVAARIPEHWKNRLLTRAECEQFDAEMLAQEKAQS